MKQAGHASKGMNKLYNDNKHIRGKKILESNDESKKEFEDNDDILPIMNDDNDDKNEDGDENEYEYEDEDEDEDDIHCVTCKKGDNEEEMLICDCCDKGYHTECAMVEEIPEYEWYCKECYAEPKSEIIQGFETHAGRLIKYKTTPKGKWKHACVEFYDHKTKKHTLALGKFYNYEEVIGKIDRLKKVNNFDMNESFKCNRLRFTDKDRWNTKVNKKKRNSSEKRKQAQIEYNEEDEEDEEDSDHYE